MKTLDLIAYKRNGFKKADTKKIRAEGHIPTVLYGNKQENIHIYVPAILFRDLVYTNKIHFVNLDVEGSEYWCILQDIQFHPVSEAILHADFLVLDKTKPIKMNVPIRFVGTSPGIMKGGKLQQKLRSIQVKSLPQHMPEFIEVSIDGLDLGQSIKIAKLETQDYSIVNNPQIPIASIQIPRSLRSAATKAEKD